MKKENYEIVHLDFIQEVGQRKGMLLSFLYNVVSSGKPNWAQTTIADILSYKAIKTIHRDLKWLQDKGFIAYSKIHRGYLHLTHFELSDKTKGLISDNSKESPKESKESPKEPTMTQEKRDIITQIFATKGRQHFDSLINMYRTKFTNNEITKITEQWQSKQSN
jgi:hypothetical protein